MTRNMADHVEQYATNGVVCIREAFDSDWVLQVTEAVEHRLARPGRWFAEHAPEEGPGCFVSDLMLSQHDSTLRNFALKSPAAEIVAHLLNAERVNFFYDSMFIKKAGVRKSTVWHQDQPYLPIDGDQVCVLWMPLDPVPASVSLEFVRGSHRWGHRFDPPRFTEGTNWYEENRFDPMPDVDNNRDSFDIISFEMLPGDCVIFHGLTLHGAKGNSLNYDRRAYSSVWLGDNTAWLERSEFTRPTFEGHGLSDGDPIDCEMFPRVWPRL